MAISRVAKLIRMGRIVLSTLCLAASVPAAAQWDRGIYYFDLDEEMAGVLAVATVEGSRGDRLSVLFPAKACSGPIVQLKLAVPDSAGLLPGEFGSAVYMSLSIDGELVANEVSLLRRPSSEPHVVAESVIDDWHSELSDLMRQGLEVAISLYRDGSGVSRTFSLRGSLAAIEAAETSCFLREEPRLVMR